MKEEVRLGCSLVGIHDKVLKFVGEKLVISYVEKNVCSIFDRNVGIV